MITTTTFAVALAVMYVVDALKILRVSREGELYGLDLHEHGISAYPEYVISALAAPAGVTAQSQPAPAIQTVAFQAVLPEVTK